MRRIAAPLLPALALLPVLMGLPAAAAAQDKPAATAAAGTAPAASAPASPAPLSGQEVQALYAEARDRDRDGAYPAAEAVLARVVAAVEQATGAETMPTAQALRAWAVQATNVAKFAEAETALRRSLAIVRKFRGDRHPDHARLQLDLAGLYLLLDRTDEAAPLIRTAAAHLKRSFGPRHAATADGVVMLARLAQQQDKLAEAETHWNEAINLLQGGRRPDPSEVSGAMHGLAATYLYQHDAPAAIEMLGRVIAAVEQSVGRQDVAYGLVLQSLARVQINEGSYVDARKTIETAIAEQRKLLPADHPVLGRSFVILGEVLALLDDAAQSDAMFDLGERIIVAAHTDRHPEYLAVLYQRIAANRQLGREGEAETIMARSEALRQALKRTGTSL